MGDSIGAIGWYGKYDKDPQPAPLFTLAPVSCGFGGFLDLGFKV